MKDDAFDDGVLTAIGWGIGAYLLVMLVGAIGFMAGTVAPPLP